MTVKRYIVQCCCASRCKSKVCSYKRETEVDAEGWNGSWRKSSMGCRRSRSKINKLQAMIDIVRTIEATVDALPA
jgi:hypothetical protein